MRGESSGLISKSGAQVEAGDRGSINHAGFGTNLGQPLGHLEVLHFHGCASNMIYVDILFLVLNFLHNNIIIGDNSSMHDRLYCFQGCAPRDSKTLDKSLSQLALLLCYYYLLILLFLGGVSILPLTW